MKRSTVVFISLFFLSACSNGKNEAQQGSAKDSAVYYPFAPVYSNEFDKGSPQQARSVLQVWRQYETGDVTRERASFADSIRFILPDGILYGSRDSVLKQYQKKRAGYSNMQCFIGSWMPVRVADRGHDLVFVWGLYDGTKRNGDRDYAMVHEVWRFNRKGKIREMEQFRTHPH